MSAPVLTERLRHDGDASGRWRSSRRRAAAAWTTPIDPASLVFLRVGLGAVLAWELWRYLANDLPQRYYADPPVHFKIWPFDWVEPLPGSGMTWLFVAMSLSAAAVAVGVFFRPACLFLGVGMAYVFFADSAYYLNHWYLATVLVLLLALTPAGSVWSIDTRAGAVERRTSAPGWTVWVFRFQVGVVYFFAGVAKVNGDWLAGRPLGLWLERHRDFPVIGRWLTDHGAPVIVLAVAATLFDIVVVGLMLSPRTRRFAYPISIGFHLMNSRLFHIGMFPWLMMLATAVFFEPDFPRRLVADVRAGRHRVATAGGALVVGGLSAWLPNEFSAFTVTAGAVAGAIAGYHLGGGGRGDGSVAGEPSEREPLAVRRSLTWLIVAWMGVQLLLPLRPYVYPGNAAWTEEGQQFAWRLLLRTKTGTVLFDVHDPVTGRTVTVDPNRYSVDGHHLSIDQRNNLAEQPDMIVQFARYLESQYREPLGGHDLEVRARTEISLNGHRPGPLVDPDVDLTKVSRPWLPPAEWIEPPPT